MTEKKNVSPMGSDHRFEIHIGENQNEEAEDELRRQIDKTDFERSSLVFVLLSDRSVVSTLQNVDYRSIQSRVYPGDTARSFLSVVHR